VGRHDAESEPDIQLSGLGIQSEHCQLLIENGQLFMEPLGNSACFLNGSPVISRVLLRHGDRLLWGNNHFFRVNCPRRSPTANSAESEQADQQPDFNFAREELVLKEMSNDPIQVRAGASYSDCQPECAFRLPPNGCLFEISVLVLT